MEEEPIKIENPWNIQSLFELQFFICPSCEYRDTSKQDFINHASNLHPESIDSLKNIKDGSISDVICPWNPVRTIKMEIEPKFDQDFNDDSYYEDDGNNSQMDSYGADDEVGVENNKKESNFSCESCAKTFSNSFSLRRHVKGVHEKKTKFTCDQCKYKNF